MSGGPLTRAVRAALRALLRPDDVDALGDLDEEHARRIANGRGWTTEIWYAAEGLSLATAVLRDRVTDGRTDGRKGGRPRRRTTRETTMDATARDVRHAVRSLSRDAGTTVVIALTLAIGVGATTAIFAVADAAFLRPLPYPDADRLVLVYSGSRDDPAAAFALSPLDLRDLEEYAGVVEEIGAWSVAETVHLTEGEEPRRLVAPRTTANLFAMLGVEPAVGRFFTPEEEALGDDDAVVLSHGLWVDAFGGDPGVVGDAVVLDGRPHRVVGVAPPDGVLPAAADAWRPLALGPEWYDAGRWGWQFLEGIARLRPEVDAPAAEALLTARLAESVPDRVERGQTRRVRTLVEQRAGTTGRGVVLLLGAVALLLLLACANVMNVMLARAERRVREFGLRRALGSGAAGLTRLVAIETAVLGLLGGVGGIVLARWALGVLRQTELSGVGYLDALAIDGRIVSFALAVTGATGILFGLAPVLRALRTDPHTVLRESGARAGSSRAARRMRDGLVVAQVALACVLLVAVGLSASTFLSLVDRDPGFRPDGVLAATIELPTDGYAGEEGATFYRSLFADISGIPGVERAGAVYALPLTGRGWTASIELIDPDPTVTDPDPGGNMRPVGPGYFATMEIPLLAGRTFTDADDGRGPPVVVIDDALARRYWPSGSPVGRSVQVGALSTEPATIIGVVGDVPDESVARAGHGHVYFSVLQRATRELTLVLRAEDDPAALAPALREVVRAADPRIPVTSLLPVTEVVAASLAAPRIGLLLLATLGGVALLLAMLGIYGVLAYTVARRRGEIGTRMALGAAPRAVVSSIVRSALRLWAVGVALGATGAVGATMLLDRWVQGVQIADPKAYGAALLVLAAVALLAALVPALRATAIDPARSLRAE